MPDTAIYTLYISDDAFDGLVSQARMLSYVRGTETAKGLSEYVAFLMICNMHDARPDDVRAQDANMLSIGMSPDWRLYSPRIRRRVKLSAVTLIEGAAHALRLGIAYPASLCIAGAPLYTDFEQCMSALLEAIGTEWVHVKVKQDE